MKKYWQIFKVSLMQELAYRWKFIVGRLQNIIQIFLIFFLWDAVFQDPGREIFGYDRAKILTYVFGLLILKSIVTSSKAADISGIISAGDLTNYLLKPINFLKSWFSRDLSSKVLNTTFAIVEASILYLLLKPPFFLQNRLPILLGFVASLVVGVLLFFLMLSLVSFIPFWLPEQTWPPVFLFLTIAEILSGAIFPLDIFPQAWQNILYLTPFPYLLFVPLQFYLGKLDTIVALKSLGIASLWVVVFVVLIKRAWKVGLREYRAEGR
jgi:ABC-2 type transport system permease protein